jgi:anti-sigma factor RsiW
MCEFSDKLIAWLDQELPADRAAKVARHVLECASCREEVELYRELGETIDAYCDRALAAQAKRRSGPLLWRPRYAAPSFAAAAVLLFFLSVSGRSSPLCPMVPRQSLSGRLVPRRQRSKRCPRQPAALGRPRSGLTACDRGPCL